MAAKVNITEPKNDREFLLKLNSQMERLSEAIDRLDDTLKEIENKKLVVLEKKITELEKFKNESVGKWKAISLIAIIVSSVAFIIQIVKAL
jgi:septal ring factor EnvC (AmiA/AmiB activator)